MKKSVLLLLLLLTVWVPTQATNYYVAATTGTNTTANSTGLSPTRPFATIQYAADRTLPGDTVFIRAGTYVNGPTGANLVTLRRSGTPSSWIVYRNYPGERPLLQFNNWNAITMLDGASYIEISGLRVQGNNRNVNLTDAINQPGGCAAGGVGAPNPIFNGNGISVEGRSNISTAHPHHIRIVSNEVFECGTVGISAIQADYITIENNLVYNNSWYTIYGGSGISVLSSWNYDNTTGYRTIVTNNRSFGNRLYVPWFSAGRCMGIFDGNGIIIDSNRLLGYTGRTLVANNLVVNNGGSGIHAFSSDHVDIIHNTAYHNEQSPEVNDGEIFTNRTTDGLIQNNILCADASNVLNTNYNSLNVTHLNNLFFGGTAVAVLGTAYVRADPQFVNPTTDWATANFQLRSTSPALDKGLTTPLLPTDLLYRPRVVGASADIGAYEYNGGVLATAAAQPLVTLAAYPNPFTSHATLRYTTARPGAVRLEVFDALGRRVGQLVDQTQAAGLHEVRFEGVNQAPGLYYVQLTTPAGLTTCPLLHQ
jgi:parallel beta-helix repeat protein